MMPPAEIDKAALELCERFTKHAAYMCGHTKNPRMADEIVAFIMRFDLRTRSVVQLRALAFLVTAWGNEVDRASAAEGRLEMLRAELVSLRRN